MVFVSYFSKQKLGLIYDGGLFQWPVETKKQQDTGDKILIKANEFTKGGKDNNDSRRRP